MKKILAVDDEGVVLNLVEMILAKEGYEVEGAMSGQEALEKVKDFKPDLVVLDIMMPGMDGIQVTEKLKSDPDTKHIPILALTVLTEKPFYNEIMEAGCDAYMPKPFEKARLVEKVNELLSN